MSEKSGFKGKERIVVSANAAAKMEPAITALFSPEHGSVKQR